jgi:hypothetical protein
VRAHPFRSVPTIRPALTSTCWPPPPPRPAQPVNYNLVGGAGRFETGRLLFRPLPGDVGACDASDAACSGLAANGYFLLRNQRLWRCARRQRGVRARTHLAGAVEPKFTRVRSFGVDITANSATQALSPCSIW